MRETTVEHRAGNPRPSHVEAVLAIIWDKTVSGGSLGLRPRCGGTWISGERGRTEEPHTVSHLRPGVIHLADSEPLNKIADGEAGIHHR